MTTRNYVTIVSGLPRSGTSMMMKMLHAGGLPVLTDNVRAADIDNPEGYFELEKAKQVKQDSSWMPEAVGRCFKAVSLLLKDMPAGYDYRIVFMQRKISEMLASQEKMLARMGKAVIIDQKTMETIYVNHLAEMKEWLKNKPNIEAITVNFSDVIDTPEAEAKRINEFLGGTLDERKMAEIVNPELYRNRA